MPLCCEVPLHITTSLVKLRIYHPSASKIFNEMPHGEKAGNERVHTDTPFAAFALREGSSFQRLIRKSFLQRHHRHGSRSHYRHGFHRHPACCEGGDILNGGQPPNPRDLSHCGQRQVKAADAVSVKPTASTKLAFDINSALGLLPSIALSSG